MPDFGITSAIRKAVSGAAKDAKVLRPGEVPRERPPTTGLDVNPTTAPVTPADPLNTPPPPVDVTEPMQQPNFRSPDDVAAERLSTAKLGDYDLDESFQTNFDTINTTDDIKATIADVAKTNSARIDEARRGTITNEQLQGLADDLDIDSDVVSKIMQRESGGAVNAETILAARKVLNSSAQRLKNLADKVTTGKATDLERIQFRRQMQFHAEYQTQFMGARAEAGRALNAFAIPAGTDAASLRGVRELVDNLYGDTDKLARVISETDNLPAVNKLARKYTSARIAGTLNELFVNAILSGPRTHIVNIAGNVLMQAMTIGETAVAARLGRFLGTTERVEIGEASALLHGAVTSTRDALRLAGRAMREGRTLDDIVKYESVQGPTKAISAENWLKPEWQATPLGRFIDGLGHVIRAPTERVMAPTDEFFKTMAYRGELERQAFLHAMDQVNSGAVKVGDAGRVAKDFLEDAPLTAQNAANEYAQYVTFQNPLGDAGRKFQLAIRSVPALGLIAPFIRTPINIFKAGLLDRSPVAFFTKKFYSDLSKGGRTRDMALARVSMGSATAAFIAHQVTQGNVSGGGPKDVEARQLLEMTGWRPYSARVPFTNVWHSYARMEPWASTVGATADAVEIMSYINEDADTMADESQQATQAVAAIVAGIANNTMSKTFMKGMSDFTETLTDPGRYAQNYGGEMAQAILPYSAARRQFVQINDPYLREAWTVLDKVKASSGIPGWSEEAPPRRDIFGDPRRQKESSVLGSMSPIPESRVIEDPITDELVSLMKETRQVPATMPGKSVEGMRLKAEEYNDLVLISRTMPIFGGTRTYRDELERVMSTSVYALATPDYKVELLKSVQNSADSIARAKLEKTNESFAERIALYRAKKDRLLYGEK